MTEIGDHNWARLKGDQSWLFE